MASIMFSLDIVFAQPKAHGAVEGSADRPTAKPVGVRLNCDPENGLTSG
jgi:hypothetical protein